MTAERIKELEAENCRLRTRLVVALWGSDWSYWVYPGVCWVVPDVFDCVANYEAEAEPEGDEYVEAKRVVEFRRVEQ